LDATAFSYRRNDGFSSRQNDK